MCKILFGFKWGCLLSFVCVHNPQTCIFSPFLCIPTDEQYAVCGRHKPWDVGMAILRLMD